MDKQTSVSIAEPGCLCIAGELNMHTVPDALRQLQQQLAGLSGQLVVDLQDVSRSDSAGVAMLIEILREARQRGLQVSFRHLPEQMLAIIHASDLDEILPVTAN